MIQKEFDLLNLTAKSNYLWANGEYIASRTYYNHPVNLHTLDGFFVEVHYNPEDNCITRVESVHDNKVLALYTWDIDITGLFK